MRTGALPRRCADRRAAGRAGRAGADADVAVALRTPLLRAPLLRCGEVAYTGGAVDACEAASLARRRATLAVAVAATAALGVRERGDDAATAACDEHSDVRRARGGAGGGPGDDDDDARRSGRLGRRATSIGLGLG